MREEAPARKTAFRVDPCGGVHYLTFSCYHRLPLFGHPAIRDEYVSHLARARNRQKFKLLAWVIMPEHVHILLIPTATPCPQWPEGDGAAIPAILNAIKKPFAEKIIARWRELRWERIGSISDSSGNPHYWQPGGGFDRNVRDMAELDREIRYVHLNPVTRRLVTTSTDWRWSSARWYAGDRDAPLPIDCVMLDQQPFPRMPMTHYLGDHC